VEKEIHTIGHSNHSPEELVRLLQAAKIKLLVDVRSSPYSEWAKYTEPHQFTTILKSAGIRYQYLGDVLGGRPDCPSCYNSDGKPEYSLIRQQMFFQNGIERLSAVAAHGGTCIMCAEENPEHCHRNLLVGAAMAEQGFEVKHVRGNGVIQTEEDLAKVVAGVSRAQLSLL
jgi:uncharacterized protein (DUF488 family)